jgi:hypothetical protein
MAQPDPAFDERHAAIELTGRIVAGDIGAVKRFVNQMEHGLSPWAPDPWRLLEHVAELLISQRQPPDPQACPEPATRPQTGG